MEQEIGYCTTEDGVSIAYATISGGDLPVVYATGWPVHLQFEWERAHSRALLEDLARGCRLIRYDMRGTGLSDRNVDDFPLPSLIKDLEAVVDHLKLDQFALVSLGMLACPIAIEYATKHSDRVTHLVLSSAFVRGGEIVPPERQRTLIEFVGQFGFPHFGLGDRPNVDAEAQEGVRAIQRAAASKQTEATLLRLFYQIDVTDSLAAITVPTLVIHGRGDRAMPIAQGQEIARTIPGCKFVTFDGTSSMPWAQRDIVTPEIHKFLGLAIPSNVPPGSDTHTILFTDMASSTALTEQLGDAAAQEVRRAHNDIVRGALASNGGNEIKHTGDGIMASFGIASAGLQAAIDIQRGVAQHKKERPDSPLAVYVGLNAGEPIAEDDDLFGTSINLAARICDHANAGQILTANVVRELAAGKQFLFADLGETELRGFEDPIKLWELRWAEGSPQETSA